MDLGVPDPDLCRQACLRGGHGLPRRRPGFSIWWRFLQAGAVPGASALLAEVSLEHPLFGARVIASPLRGLR